jgi:hypothetical protein
MELSKSIPETIQIWIESEGGNEDYAIYWRNGAEAMYHRMAEEAETLRKERDAYLGLLNELKAALAHHDTLTIVQQSGFHQCCQLCKGKGKIKKPGEDKRTARQKKVDMINDLRDRGYTVREIMVFFGYKSTSAIAYYLTPTTSK